MAAGFLRELRSRKVTPGESPKQIRALLRDEEVPQGPTDPRTALRDAARLLFDHSLLNGHPRFWGYVTSSAAPIGALGDFLASVVNPNVGAYSLSPAATELERQTVRWLAEMVGYDTRCGGLLVSGGNMANLVAFLVARTAMAPWEVKEKGIAGGKGRRLVVYASKETHAWLLKAADLFGLGLESIHWIPVDGELRMDLGALRRAIKADLRKGDVPFMVVGNAGTVQTGAIDPLRDLSAICKEHGLWFHVDGAYGAFAALLPEAPADLGGMSKADSVALDPHKWLYAPLEAGCILVRRERLLRQTFSHHPAYYHFEKAGEETPVNFYEYGLQNSRGFRALKVWLAIKQVGLSGYRRMISDDVKLARKLFETVGKTPELEALTNSLSITTFRYVPRDLLPGRERTEKYLNRLNELLVDRLQADGEIFPSNAVIRGKFALRCCIVNFRTSKEDVEDAPKIVVRVGRQVDSEIRRKGRAP